MLNPETAKINELKHLCLPRVWIEIAELLGYELFVKFWQIASTPENQDRRALYVPTIKKLYECQKSLLIQQYLAEKKTNSQIIQKLKEIGLTTNIDNIRRIKQRTNF